MIGDWLLHGLVAHIVRNADVLAAATALASDDFLAASTWKWFDLQRRTGAPTYYYYFARVRPRW